MPVQRLPGRFLVGLCLASLFAGTMPAYGAEEAGSKMPSCEQSGPHGSRKAEGYIPVAQDDDKDATTLHYQVLLPPCKDTDGDGTLDFEGPYPIVVDYSGYRPAIAFNHRLDQHFLSEGYAVAGVNLRGTGCSGGYFDFAEPRQSTDGAEAIDFLGKQDYSTGRVAMVGKSWPGVTQLFVAAEQPQHLAAIVPGQLFSDLYRDVAYPGGVQNVTFVGGFGAGRIYDQIFDGPGKAIGHDFEFKFPQKNGEPDLQCARNQLDHVPNPAINPFVQAVQNQYDSEAYNKRSPWYFAHKIEVPTFLVESWQDEQIGSRGTELTERFNHELEWRFLGTNGDHHEYFGAHVLSEIKRFLRYHLAQEVPSVDRDRFGDDFEAALSAYKDESPVQINWENGVAGDRAPAWKKHYSSWPPPMVDEDDPWRLYLTGDGLLTPDPSAANNGPATTSYNYVPGVGTQQRGGYKLHASLPEQTIASWGETPPEGTYGLFQTHRLSEDRLLAGPASLDLWVSSSAVDTDFQVTLTEVRPDGKEVFVQQGWMRASHRKLIEDALALPIDTRGNQNWSTPLRPFHSHRAEDSIPLAPGEPTHVRIEIFPFAHAFRAGSALRVYVEAPHTKPDMWGFGLIPAPARNTIYTGGDFPSSLALPLLEGQIAEVGLPPCNMGPVHSPLRNQPCRDAIRPLPTEKPSQEARSTTLIFTDTPASGQYSDGAKFAARLTDEGGAPVPGKAILFELTSGEGTRSFTATTDEDGFAQTTTTLTERPGPAQLTASFDGSEDAESSAATMSYLIEKEDTVLTLSAHGRGDKRTLVAILTDSDSGVGITRRPIEFSADETTICRPAPETDDSGTATCRPPARYRSGPHSYVAVFQEDNYYLGSRAAEKTEN